MMRSTSAALATPTPIPYIRHIVEVALRIFLFAGNDEIIWLLHNFVSFPVVHFSYSRPVLVL